MLISFDIVLFSGLLVMVSLALSLVFLPFYWRNGGIKKLFSAILFLTIGFVSGKYIPSINLPVHDRKIDCITDVKAYTDGVIRLEVFDENTKEKRQISLSKAVGHNIRTFYDVSKDSPQYITFKEGYWAVGDIKVHLHELENEKGEGRHN